MTRSQVVAQEDAGEVVRARSYTVFGGHDRELTLYFECVIRLLKCFKQGSDMIRSVF